MLRFDMRHMMGWRDLNRTIVDCRLCPRLVKYREHVAETKRRAFIQETYWGRPITGYGDLRARVLVVGLAPAAHGGNRTGRVLTGDPSGNFLMKALHAKGLSNNPFSISRDDGLVLRDVFLTAVVRCAPPKNKPAREEFGNCQRYIVRELRLLSRLRVFVTLGGEATAWFLKAWDRLHPDRERVRVHFRHGGVFPLEPSHTLITSYHPSQRNTQTGTLTMPMFVSVFRKARAIVRGR